MLAVLFGWAVLFVIASQLIKRDVVPAGPLAWLVAAVPTLVGVFVLLAYARFIREGDELQRLIHLQGLAIGFGCTWFAVSGYRILERAGAPSLDGGDAILAMSIFYAVGMVLAGRRYR